MIELEKKIKDFLKIYQKVKSKLQNPLMDKKLRRLSALIQTMKIFKTKMMWMNQQFTMIEKKAAKLTEIFQLKEEAKNV